MNIKYFFIKCINLTPFYYFIIYFSWIHLGAHIKSSECEILHSYCWEDSFIDFLDQHSPTSVLQWKMELTLNFTLFITW